MFVTLHSQNNFHLNFNFLFLYRDTKSYFNFSSYVSIYITRSVRHTQTNTFIDLWLTERERERGLSSWMALNKTVLEGNGRQKRIPRTPMGASSSAALKSSHIWSAAISKSGEKKWNEVKGKVERGKGRAAVPCHCGMRIINDNCVMGVTRWWQEIDGAWKASVIH